MSLVTIDFNTIGDQSKEQRTKEFVSLYNHLSACGLLDSQFARLLHVSPKTIQRFKNERNYQPSDDLLDAYLGYLRRVLQTNTLSIQPIQEPEVSVWMDIVKVGAIDPLWLMLEKTYTCGELHSSWNLGKALFHNYHNVQLLVGHELKAYFYNRMAVIAFKLGHLKDAKRFVLKAEDQVSAHDEPLFNIVIDNKAAILLQLKRPTEALRLLDSLAARQKLSIAGAFNGLCASSLLESTSECLKWGRKLSVLIQSEEEASYIKRAIQGEADLEWFRKNVTSK